MHLTYHHAKNASNIAKHGVSFDEVAECDWALMRYETAKIKDELHTIASVPLRG